MSKKNIVSASTKGSAYTPAGTLNKAQLARHKLIGNFPVEASFARRRGKSFKRLVESWKGYRLMAHGVTEKKLARPAVLFLHYMMTPFAKTHGEADAAEAVAVNTPEANP